MKATGIIRRIDDLGRVVIPKEIRRTIRVRDGDPMEIFVGGDGMVGFKRYDSGSIYIEAIDRIIADVSEDYDFKSRSELISQLQEAKRWLLQDAQP